MAKKDSIWRLVIVLTCISLLAALALTGVYALTKGPIELGQKEKKEKAEKAAKKKAEKIKRDEEYRRKKAEQKKKEKG